MSIDSYPNPAVAGKVMTYHVTVTGNTGKPCTGVTIALKLPKDVTFRSSRPDGSHSGSEVRWSRSRLHNETANYWAEVTVNPGASRFSFATDGLVQTATGIAMKYCVQEIDNPRINSFLWYLPSKWVC